MDNPIRACLKVDDAPSNPTYWWRYQQTAFGYDLPDIGFGGPWRELARAPYFPARTAELFADMVEEFNVRGKFSLLPCPAGHGRLDRSVRSIPPAELEGVLRVVRDRLASRFDITPEVLTHTMALDIETGALLPHAESAWVSHLCRSGQVEPLIRYLRHGWSILRNVGIRARGLTIGGMTDCSNIAEGDLLYNGGHRDTLGQALLAVETEFDPHCRLSFLFAGTTAMSERARRWNAPEPVWTSPSGQTLYDVYSSVGEPFLDIWYGGGDVAAATDALMTPDLSSGLLVEQAEAGRAVSITTHAQTLHSMGTCRGLAALREALRRFHERYGRRIQWFTPCELAQAMAGLK